MTSVSPLRDLLRVRTAEAHAALEGTPLMRVISSGLPTLEQYGAYLMSQCDLHAPLEAALRDWVTPDWREHRLVKTHWLREDLRALGHPAGTVPDAAAEIGCEAEALGVLYVLEGGTLGLQMVRKRLQADHPACTTASRFMQGYGSETGSNWRAFVQRLEALPQAAWPRALDAADATFAAFAGRFARSEP